MFELVIGGARSGKSAYAEQCALEYTREHARKYTQSNPKSTNGAILYIATATAGDDEMARRIHHHQNARPESWQTIEEPIKLANALTQASEQSAFIIVDCLTLWLTNLLVRDNEQRQQEIDLLFSTLPELTSSVIFVTNEIGMGVVPLGEETRRFVDEAGRLHQRLATQCHRVTQMIAGIPNRIKDEPTD